MNALFGLVNVDRMDIWRMMRMAMTSLKKTHAHEHNELKVHLVIPYGACPPEEFPIAALVDNLWMINIDKEQNGSYVKSGIKMAVEMCKGLGEGVFISADMIIQSDLSHVFDIPDWEVGAVKRHIPMGRLYPYNGGIVFCRNWRFWEELYNDIPFGLNDGMEYERRFSFHVTRQHFRRLELPGEYNWDPSKRREDVSHARVVHYKSWRNKWMFDREKEILGE
jgi:hypothetical protein